MEGLRFGRKLGNLPWMIALRPLRLPGFKSLGVAYLVNELGNWLGEIALAVLVYDQTGSPMATAALFCGMQFLPALIGPPIVARLENLPARLTLPDSLRRRVGCVRCTGVARARVRLRRGSGPRDLRRLDRVGGQGADPRIGRVGARPFRPAA